MRIRSLLSLTVSLIIVGALGCGGSEPPPETPPPPPAETPPAPPNDMPAQAETPPVDTAKADVPPPAPPKKAAKDVLMQDGAVFMFSLDDSPDAKKMSSDECAKKAKKDDKKRDACLQTVTTAASTEGVRIDKDPKGNPLWVSFGKEKDKEVLYNKVPVKVVSSDQSKVTLAPDGKDSGKKPLKGAKEIVVDVQDDNTIAISDSKKGKLVYKKR